jgi:hypothetical protein
MTQDYSDNTPFIVRFSSFCTYSKFNQLNAFCWGVEFFITTTAYCEGIAPLFDGAPILPPCVQNPSSFHSKQIAYLDVLRYFALALSGKVALALHAQTQKIMRLQGQHLCERIVILIILIWLERPWAGDLECERVSGQWPPAAAVEAAKVYR